MDLKTLLLVKCRDLNSFLSFDGDPSTDEIRCNRELAVAPVDQGGEQDAFGPSDIVQ